MIKIAILLKFFFSVFANFTSVNLNECKITHKGTEYLGNISKTEIGVTCQYWGSAKHKGKSVFSEKYYQKTLFSKRKNTTLEKYNQYFFPSSFREGSELIRDEAFPDGSKFCAKNYCRNPNQNPKGPWCYTAKKMLIFDTCDIPLCKIADCRISGPGMEYAGLIEKSVSGKKCTKWKNKFKLKEHQREISFKNRLFPDGSIGQAGRKCRNPDGSISGPWCYVEGEDCDMHVKELCDIPFCGDMGNFMYSEGSDPGKYFFFSRINNSQSFNISFRLWNPESWLHGEIFLYLGAYDIASEREDIERWSSGVEIKFSHNGSGFLFKDAEALKKTPLILSGAKWTDLDIAWAKSDESLYITVFQKPNIEPIALGKIPIRNTVFEVESFRYVSLGGSPAFWNIPSSSEDCPVHTVTNDKVTRFWLIKKSILSKDIEVFIRAKKVADITMREAPMKDTNQVQVIFGANDKIKVFTYNNSNCRLLGEISWSNALNFWKWEYFRIQLFQDKLRLFWIRETITLLLLEVSHENVEKVMWVTFGSLRVSYWTIYCDPRGISDPPPATPPECISQKAEPFYGTMSITSSGRQCIPWSDKASLPKKYSRDDLYKPYGGIAKCQNFCRNLDGDPKGAYCIVRNHNSDSGFGLEHCLPRSCSLADCKLAGTGNDYTGKLNITRSKRNCKFWTEVNDKTIDIKNFPDPTLVDARNFCRNPSKNVAGTWCYTTDSKVPRDACYIRDCDKPLECTVLSTGYADGNFVYIVPHWRKNGLRFALKAWNPDIYEGLIISLFSMDGSKQYRLLLGDEDNEKLKFYYKDEKSMDEILLLQKTLPHLIPSGKWKTFWLRPGNGKIELGYDGVPTPFFEWTSPRNEMSFKPMLINFGTIKNHWIGINFHCSECLTTKTYSQEGYKIYPINIWRGDTSVSKLRLNLRGTGSAFITLIWTPDFQKLLAIQIVANTTNIFIVKFEQHDKQVLGTFTVSSIITEHEWSEYTISFTESSITVHKGTIQLFEWMSPFPLLIYWFTVTAEGGVITWTANCPPPDIDGEPRDGNWGRWGSWSCSVTCGKGEGRIERKCNDPPPNVFGDECKGSSAYEGPCNDFPCGKISPDTNSIIRQYLSSQHKSLQVDVSERVVLRCNSKALSLVASEVSEMNITWTHNGFPYSRTRFHMDENYSLVIPRAQDKHSGIYLCIAYQEPDSIPSKVVLEVISLVVIKQKPTKKIRKGKSLILKCNGLALSYVYADLSQRWELNGTVWKDYGLGTLQAFTVDKLENVSDSHAGVWTCVIIQEDFKFKWTTNWIYLKVKSAPSFWSRLMEDMATAPLFGKLGNERNAMILFFALIGFAFVIISTVVFLLVKCFKK